MSNEKTVSRINSRWGDFKVMSREDLLLTKADIESSLFSIKERITQDEKRGVGIDRLLRVKRFLMEDYQRCNVYIGVEAAKSKASESMALKFYLLAKEQLDPAIFINLKAQAKA